MTAKRVSDAEFIAIWNQSGSPDLVAKITGVSVRNVYKRRLRIENAHGIVLTAFNNDFTGRGKIRLPKIGPRQLATVKSGVVIVFSDAHFWPGERSTAFDALVRLINDMEPKLIVCNGDAFDGSRISRFPPTEWAHQPTVNEELDAVKERLAEIESAAPPKTPLVWCLGNHDSRLSMRLAQVAPEYVGVHGMDLPDHFPAWCPSWSCMINGDIPDGMTMIKHRYNNGIHAAYNNTLRSGVSIVTGHLHKLQVTPWGDYNGRRYGIDCGTISDFGPEATKFTTYSEDNPLPWGSGFCVLTYDAKGMLLPPELVECRNDTAYFRGRAISMDGKKALEKA